MTAATERDELRAAKEQAAACAETAERATDALRAVLLVLDNVADEYRHVPAVCAVVARIRNPLVGIPPTPEETLR